MVLPDPDNFGLAADPSMLYGNQSVYDMQASYYGDDQAAATGMRSSYGDTAYTAMRGAGAFGAGAYQGLGNMFSQLGSMVRPVTYTPPARVQTGYYGHYVQETGFLRGLTGMFGINDVPRGTSAYEYNLRGAGDFGQRVASGVTAAGVMAGSIAAGYSLSGVGSAIGGTLGAAFGPVGAGVGASIGGLGASFVGAMGGDYLLNQVAARQNLGNYLEASSFRFVGAGSSMVDPRFQAGMSRKARDEASSYIRGLDTKDPMLDTNDMSTILQESTRLGLFTGTQDMDDFKKKFKDITENVKTVSKFLHTTLKEGLETIKQLKGIGIDVADSGTMAVQAAALGRVAGRTGSEMLGIGLQGAEMYRGTGVDMGIGAQASMMNLAQIRSARDAGLLSQQTIAQMGGEEAFALRKTASNLQFAQSSIGRGFNAAFFNPAMGNGGFDQQAFTKSIQDPNMSAEQQIIQSARNLGSPEAVMTYMANQEKFVEGMQNAFGKQGGEITRINAISSTAKYYSKMTGGKVPVDVAYRAIGKQQLQLSDMEITADLAKLKDTSGFFKKQNQAINAQEVMLTVEGAYAADPLQRMGGRILDYGKKVTDAVMNPAFAGSRALSEGFQTFQERHRYGLERASFSATVDMSGVITPEQTKAANELRKERSYDLTVGYDDQADYLNEAKKLGYVAFNAKNAPEGTKGMAYLGGGKSVSVESLNKALYDSKNVRGMSRADAEKFFKEKKLVQSPLSPQQLLSIGELTLPNIYKFVNNGESITSPTQEGMSRVYAATAGVKEASEAVDDGVRFNRRASFNRTMAVQDINKTTEELTEIQNSQQLADFGLDEVEEIVKAATSKDPNAIAKVLLKARGQDNENKKGIFGGLFSKSREKRVQRALNTVTSGGFNTEQFLVKSESLRQTQIELSRENLGDSADIVLKPVHEVLSQVSQGKLSPEAALTDQRFRAVPESYRKQAIDMAAKGQVEGAIKKADDAFYLESAPKEVTSAASLKAAPETPGSGSKELADMSAERQMNAVIYENLLALANRLRL